MAADRTARRTRLAADLDELRAIRQSAADDLRALPAPASRTAAQRTTARNLRFQLLVCRVVLNGLNAQGADRADLDDAT